MSSFIDTVKHHRPILVPLQQRISIMLISKTVDEVVGALLEHGVTLVVKRVQFQRLFLVESVALLGFLVHEAVVQGRRSAVEHL